MSILQALLELASDKQRSEAILKLTEESTEEEVKFVKQYGLSNDDDNVFYMYFGQYVFLILIHDKSTIIIRKVSDIYKDVRKIDSELWNFGRELQTTLLDGDRMRVIYEFGRVHERVRCFFKKLGISL